MGMIKRRRIEIQQQPDDFSCGPSCLAAVYQAYGDDLPLEKIIREIERVEGGGTIAVMLARHALQRGYEATIYTYNLQVFDPTWFDDKSVDISRKLGEQMKVKRHPKLQSACRGYIEFLALGGKVLLEDLTPALLRRLLKRGAPILTGLSAPYLYRGPRENPDDLEYDDVRGEPMGHFVILHGYSARRGTVRVADPLRDQPRFVSHDYNVRIDRLICAILLGVLTYDANLLIISPKSKPVRAEREGTRAE